MPEQIYHFLAVVNLELYSYCKKIPIDAVSDIFFIKIQKRRFSYVIILTHLQFDFTIQTKHVYTHE